MKGSFRQTECQSQVEGGLAFGGSELFLPRALPAVRGMSGCVDSRSGANSLKAAGYFAGSCVQTLNWESFDQVEPAEQ